MKKLQPYLLLCCMLLTSCATIADADSNMSDNSDSQNYRVRLYFGLSLPTGGGVSLQQWQDFQSNTLAKTFDGFNVVNSSFADLKRDNTSIFTGQSAKRSVKEL